MDVQGAPQDQCDREPDNFLLDFKTVFNGGPGGTVYFEHVTPTMTVEGVADDGQGGTYALYRYSASLSEPVNLTDGWINIMGVDDADCAAYWATSGKGVSALRAWGDDGWTVTLPCKDNYSFVLVNDGTPPVAETPESASSDTRTSVTPERDDVSDVAQMVWIELIDNGLSNLSPADQATVLGSVGGGGFKGNEAILQDPDFIDSIAAAIEATYGGSEENSLEAAEALIDFLVYAMSIDHNFWLDFYTGTEFEDAFTAIDARNTLNSDAGTVIGGLADPNANASNNNQEWEKAKADGLFEEALVRRFIYYAESPQEVHNDGFES